MNRRSIFGELMASQEMHPPWVQFSKLPAGDIGWRMGAGEGYLSDFCDWANSLSQKQRLDYLQRYAPLPDAWYLWAADILALPNTDDGSVDDAYGILLDAGIIVSPEEKDS